MLIELLKSDDNVEVLLGLWQKGREDISTAINAIEEILSSGKRHSILLASYYIQFIQNIGLAGKIAKKVIYQYPDDLEIFACYLDNFMKTGTSYEIYNKNRYWPI